MTLTPIKCEPLSSDHQPSAVNVAILARKPSFRQANAFVRNTPTPGANAVRAFVVYASLALRRQKGTCIIVTERGLNNVQF